MGPFVVASALLCLLVLAIVLRPLWRNRRMALGIALALPFAAAGLYALLGTPAALDPAQVRAPTTLAEAIVQLETRLADEPGSVEGWVLLGRSRVAQERWTDARDAFAKAHALLPDDPDLMVEYADALMRASADGRFPPAATALLERVVAGMPNHQRALFYLGAQRFQAGRAAEAVELWERLLPLLDPQTAAALQPQVAAARAEAGLPPPATPAPVVADVGKSLAVTVELAPAFAAQLADGAVLYVFARRADGVGPPVAVQRRGAHGFPHEIVLTDADSLMPTQKLSQLDAVQVSARVSRSGDAIAATGDFEATPQVIELGADAKIRLVIDQVHP
jgi:cytochrome c-type biogenesis protein CcmH